MRRERERQDSTDAKYVKVLSESERWQTDCHLQPASFFSPRGSERTEEILAITDVSESSSSVAFRFRQPSVLLPACEIVTAPCPCLLFSGTLFCVFVPL